MHYFVGFAIGFFMGLWLAQIWEVMTSQDEHYHRP